jgi:hypothetical protein
VHGSSVPSGCFPPVTPWHVCVCVCSCTLTRHALPADFDRRAPAPSDDIGAAWQAEARLPPLTLVNQALSHLAAACAVPSVTDLVRLSDVPVLPYMSGPQEKARGVPVVCGGRGGRLLPHMSKCPSPSNRPPPIHPTIKGNVCLLLACPALCACVCVYVWPQVQAHSAALLGAATSTYATHALWAPDAVAHVLLEQTLRLAGPGAWGVIDAVVGVALRIAESAMGAAKRAAMLRCVCACNGAGDGEGCLGGGGCTLATLLSCLGARLSCLYRPPMAGSFLCTLHTHRHTQRHTHSHRPLPHPRPVPCLCGG